HRSSSQAGSGHVAFGPFGSGQAVAVCDNFAGRKSLEARSATSVGPRSRENARLAPSTLLVILPRHRAVAVVTGVVLEVAVTVPFIADRGQALGLAGALGSLVAIGTAVPGGEAAGVAAGCRGGFLP